MKDLVIVGAGGMGRTIYDMIIENPAYGKMICKCEFVTEGEIIDSKTLLMMNWKHLMVSIIIRL